MSPRWKQCVGWVDRDLGEALGKVFVEATFRPETKRDVERMVGFIEQAMAARIRDLGWMSAETRAKAQAKLDAMRNKIGYPETLARLLGARGRSAATSSATSGAPPPSRAGASSPRSAGRSTAASGG